MLLTYGDMYSYKVLWCMIYGSGDPRSLGISHGGNLCFLLPISALQWLQPETQSSLSIPYSPSPQFLLPLLINHHRLGAQVCKANTIGAYRWRQQKRDRRKYLTCLGNALENNEREGGKGAINLQSKRAWAPAQSQPDTLASSATGMGCLNRKSAFILAL